MSDYKNIIDQETKNFIEYAKELVKLELKFREYIFEKGLSEDSYIMASAEYRLGINPIRHKIKSVEDSLPEMPKDTKYVSVETVNALNRELGCLWRFIIVNETFVNDYGGFSLTDKPVRNRYKEIYDEHLGELKEFMYYFIKIANELFNK